MFRDKTCLNYTGIAMKSHLDCITDWISLAKKAHYRADELARLNNVSQRQLQRYFADCFGKAPQSWLDDLRLIKAVHMLTNGTYVKEAAAQLNFRDVPHFSNRFKQYYGCSPSRFISIYAQRQAKRRKQFEMWCPGEEVPSRWLADPCLTKSWEILLTQTRRHRDGSPTN